jgi:hypothetical protein
VVGLWGCAHIFCALTSYIPPGGKKRVRMRLASYESTSQNRDLVGHPACIRTRETSQKTQRLHDL